MNYTGFWRWGGVGLVHPLLLCQALGQALIPLPSREGGFCRLCCLVFTLAFDSSPIKGEGDWLVGVGLLSPRPVDTALKPV